MKTEASHSSMELRHDEVAANHQVRIIIGADFVPTSSNCGLFEAGDAEGLIGADLLEVLHAADYTVFNLETPLADEATPIEKCGPCLRASVATAAGLRAVNRGAFVLANNHIMDQGSKGMISTLAALDAAGTAHFGAGMNLAEASAPFFVDISGARVGFYGCVEHEFSVATDSTPGAVAYDPLRSFDEVRDMASDCDYLVVLYHGGKEHYRYPSPSLRARCRKFVESGADLVICQHSHCVGCEERWQNGAIVYGQGNFLFDNKDDEFWKTGLLVEVVLSGSGAAINYLPVVKTSERVRLAQGPQAEEILAGFRHRSEEILDAGFIERRYAEFAQSYIGSYLGACIPGSHTLVFRAVNKLLGGRLPQLLINRKRVLALRNFIECEAHSELFIEGLKFLAGGRDVNQ